MLPGSGLACTHRSKVGSPHNIATPGLQVLRPTVLARELRQGAACFMPQGTPTHQSRIHHRTCAGVCIVF